MVESLLFIRAGAGEKKILGAGLKWTSSATLSVSTRAPTGFVNLCLFRLSVTYKSIVLNWNRSEPFFVVAGTGLWNRSEPFSWNRLISELKKRFAIFFYLTYFFPVLGSWSVFFFSLSNSFSSAKLVKSVFPAYRCFW